MTQKSLKTFQGEGKAWGQHHSPLPRLSMPLSPRAPSLVPPRGPAGLCHPLRGIERAGPGGELAAPTLPDGTLV